MQPTHQRSAMYRQPNGRAVRTIELRHEIVNSLDGFVALRSEWKELVRQSNASIFQSFEWLFGWWKHFGAHKDHQLHIIVVREEQRLVAICPFFIKHYRMGRSTLFRQLRLMGCGIIDRITKGLKSEYGPSDYLDVIVLASYRDEIKDFLLKYIGSPSAFWDEAQFLNVPHSSILYEAAQEEIQLGNAWYKMTPSDICPVLRVPPSVDQYILGRKPRVRRRFSQTQKASGKLYVIESIQSKEDIDRFFTDLIRLHQKHWNEIGYPGLFADERFLHLQQELARTFYDNGWLWFKVARHNGTAVASHLVFIFNDCLYVYVSGFDKYSSVARRRPGLALILTMMQDCIDRGVHRMDFLRGDEGYKFDFTDEAIQNYSIRIENPDAEQLPRVRMFRILAACRSGLLLMFNELMLLRIQQHQHRFPKSMYHYVRFRLERFRVRRNGTPAMSTEAESDEEGAA